MPVRPIRETTRKSALTAICASAICLWTSAALGQDREQTLADIRQDLTVLHVEMQRLKRELSTTGSPSTPSLEGTSALARVDAMEEELRRLTAATEALENRINRVVEDGTNRVGDLEFRLVELEGGDISTLGETTTLGGDVDTSITLPAIPEAEIGAELAVGEQADFDQARAAYEAGSYEAAASQFATFAESYTGGPLTSEAHFWRGKSLDALGNISGAARAFLESFSGDPGSAIAPQALLELGIALEGLGQFDEACVMLSEVTVRFPGSPASAEAMTAQSDLDCG